MNNFYDICGTFGQSGRGQDNSKVSYIMKTIKIFAAAAVLVACVACNSNKPAGNGGDADSLSFTESAIPQNPKDLLPSKSLVDSISYLLGINVGEMIKQNDLGDLNFSKIKKGAMDFIKSKPMEGQADTAFFKQFDIDLREFQDIAVRYQDQRRAYTVALKTQEERAFLAKNRNEADVKETESGLQYKIAEAGDQSQVPAANDTAFVHYTLRKISGELIQELAADQPSMQMVVSNSAGIPGFIEGLSLIGVGGKETLYVPYKLGYGENGTRGGIGPCETLVFDVVIDSLKRYVEPAPVPETPAKKK